VQAPDEVGEQRVQPRVGRAGEGLHDLLGDAVGRARRSAARGAFTGPGRAQQSRDAVPGHGSRVGVGLRNRELGSPVEIGLGEPELAQRCRPAGVVDEVEDRAGGVGGAERLGDASHRVGCGRGVVRHGVRQHDGVGGGVWQVEAAAECVAQLVVQGHADRPQARPGQPGALEEVRAGVEVVGAGPQPAQSARQPGDRVERERVDDGFGVGGVERLHGVRERVDRAGHRDRGG
jgi:hypothetical protein